MSKNLDKTYVSEQSFDHIDFTQNPLPMGEYEICTFVNCNFFSADLSNIEFSECVFQTCNLSSANLTQTALRDVRFKDCKLVGLHFENCNDFLFAVSFDHCTLKLASFYKLSLKKTHFKHCSLQEVDFTQADVSGSVFDDCDLLQAVFDNTVVEKVDFRTAFNYSLDPERNRIKKAKFSREGIVGLLDKYDIEIR